MPKPLGYVFGLIGIVAAAIILHLLAPSAFIPQGLIVVTSLALVGLLSMAGAIGRW
jgi:hypothetical protein